MRLVSPNDARAIQVRCGVVAQRVWSADSSQIQRVAVCQSLRRSARRAEELLVGGRDGVKGPLGVGGGRAAFPDALGLHVSKNLESPSGSLIGAYSRPSIDVGRRLPPIPASRG